MQVSSAAFWEFAITGLNVAQTAEGPVEPCKANPAKRHRARKDQASGATPAATLPLPAYAICF